jgi:hypothetical protein
MNTLISFTKLGHLLPVDLVMQVKLISTLCLKLLSLRVDIGWDSDKDVWFFWHLVDHPEAEITTPLC